MKIKLNFIFFGLLLIFNTFIYAVESLPNNLINFESPQGLMLLKENLNVNALKLLSHFNTQKTPTYCGVANIVMLLNATSANAPADSQHPPYHYFTQDNFFNESVKKTISPEEVERKGINLLQLSQIFQSHELKAKPFYANDFSLKTFRKKLKNALQKNEFIIVNFLRTVLKEEGGGHHSPIAAYDKKTDRFLLLDVARYKYPAYWVKTEDLWNATHTKDESSYRGFIIVTP